jgi:hypothetical protein
MTAPSLAQRDPAAISAFRPEAAPSRPLDLPLALLAILCCLLLLVGSLSSWGIKRIDRNYSILISLTALNLDQLHDISYHSGIGCATAVALSATDNPQKRAAMVRAIVEERSANNLVFAELLRKTTDPRVLASLKQVLALRAIFSNRTDDLVRGALANPGSPTLIPTSAPMLEAFIRYQKGCDSLADLIRANSIEASTELARDAVKFRVLFFTAGALPIVLGLAGILITFYYVLGTPAEDDLKP